jgi:hypothetical protein
VNIWLRWLKLLFTCGLGCHAESKLTELPGQTLYRECPRCHMAYYERRDKPKGYIVHLRPPLWDVARGLYDKGIQP